MLVTYAGTVTFHNVGRGRIFIALALELYWEKGVPSSTYVPEDERPKHGSIRSANATAAAREAEAAKQRAKEQEEAQRLLKEQEEAQRQVREREEAERLKRVQEEADYLRKQLEEAERRKREQEEIERQEKEEAITRDRITVCSASNAQPNAKEVEDGTI